MSDQGIQIETYYELFIQCKLERDLLLKELQETKAQLEKAQSFISDFKDIFEQEKDDTILSELDDLWFNYNRNFKDKQGSEK